MKPGQLTPNDFETAILERLSLSNPALKTFIGKLHVLSREFTGVGSYTSFTCPEGSDDLGNQSIGLEALIKMPKVENGMGAILFCESGKPSCLEVYTHGDEHWDGEFDGFDVENLA